ncbi:hypothetical protein [Streptomyces roseifaciens]|uniref:hypothetical protein n=1 Tax=Streptomyces roseifaciens TaxID=1488406 RepID=UPI000AFE4C5D|nr:hypothetical protein [Streptomyces roseifaciens]
MNGSLGESPDESTAAGDADIPRWMRVVSVTADVLLSLLKSGSRNGRSGGSSDGGDDSAG